MENELSQLIGQPESQTLEYKAVLPPSKKIAQLVSAFANTEGGYIILGVSDTLEINGLSEDFHANAITHKAIDLLTPKPAINYQYITYKGRKLYAIKVEKSEDIVSLEGKIYKRQGTSTVQQNLSLLTFKPNGYTRINAIYSDFESIKQNATSSKSKAIEHYQRVLRIVDDLGSLLYPVDPHQVTTNPEGKILSRILFSSFVDNFETYLSDLLYEIYLANPATLKSRKTVTLEEILNCSDLEEFIQYYAKELLGKLQKGSVKGFIAENKQISDLNAIDSNQQNEIEKILQIRHLYSHRNGIVDEKFLKYHTGTIELNTEHQMTVSEFCDKLCYLMDIIHEIDTRAVSKYSLATT